MVSNHPNTPPWEGPPTDRLCLFQGQRIPTMSSVSVIISLSQRCESLLSGRLYLRFLPCGAGNDKSNGGEPARAAAAVLGLVGRHYAAGSLLARTAGREARSA